LGERVVDIAHYRRRFGYRLADEFSHECIHITDDFGISGIYITRPFGSGSNF
jgi:hypothetical protein